MPTYLDNSAPPSQVDYDKTLYRLLAFSCHLPALASVVDASNGPPALLLVGSVSLAIVRFTRQMPELAKLALTILFYLLLLLGVDYFVHIRSDGGPWFWQRIVPVVQLAVLYYAFAPEVRRRFGTSRQQNQQQSEDKSRQVAGKDGYKTAENLTTLGAVAIFIVLQSAATAKFAPTDFAGWMSSTILALHAVLYFMQVCMAIYWQLRAGQVGSHSSQA